jgi:glutathione S-transferase
MGRVLYSESFSPWCERSRFVLLHHRLAFVEKEHVPLIGELALQLRAGRLGKKVSVPLLIDDGEVVMGSMAIAEHVERRGSGEPLLPERLHGEIVELYEWLEPVMGAGRAHALLEVIAHEDVAIAGAPRALRSLPGTASVARLGARFLKRKYGASFDGIPERLEAGLTRMRALLGGRRYVHQGLSYADVLCASALQFIAPVDEAYVPLEPATRRSFTHPELAARFRDLLDWRDALYAAHRPRS